MTPQELKNSILQLAMQGKLVEQRVEEGTGEELFKEIQNRKAELIKVGKIPKEKLLPDITDDEIPFEIPERWKWVRLQDVAYVNGGFAFKSTNFTTAGTRVIRISDFNENGFVNTKVVRHPYDDSLSPYVLEVNNILLCMTGGTVGKSLFVRTINETMVTNQRVATIKIVNDIPDYINYVILSPLTQKVIQDSKNSTNDNISMDTINNFLVPLPPLAEQQRIVAKIEELLPLIDRYENAYCQLEDFNKRFPIDMQKSILHMAMEGKLVEQRPEEGTAFPIILKATAERDELIKAKIVKKENLSMITDNEKLFDIPDNWIYVRLNDIVRKNIKRGKSPAYVSQSGTLVFAQKCNVKTGEINMDLALFLDESKLSKYSQDEYMQNEDIVVNSTGKGTLGRIGMFHNSDNPRRLPIVPDSHVTTIRVCKNISSEFIYYYLKYRQPYLERLGEGSTNQTELKPDILKNLVIGLPPLAEQKRIVAKIEELLPLCKRLK